ncbi:MliC family protein [Xanthomonas maliensis]|uniref:MliC family protein n=1 Tax=Xanthomonas maliensis TaxID=1321368 RepID=UPI0003A94844|nr:MliC family protein [Xanthomonas maliensis]KAB7769944.1 hypothetical protein CKY51_05515 [Xanthomonas maliensis]
MSSPSRLLPLLLLVGLAGCGQRERAASATPTSAPTPPAATDASVSGPPPRPSAPTTAPAPVRASQWRCGEQGVTANFDTAADAVQLEVEGRRLVLPVAESGSGARYADAQGNQFWEHAGEATLTLAGGDARQCVRSDADAVG